MIERMHSRRISMIKYGRMKADFHGLCYNTILMYLWSVGLYRKIEKDDLIKRIIYGLT